MTDSVSNDRNPTPDVAEDNAFFPSPYSLSQYTSSKTDFAGANYPTAYRGGKWKVLMIGTEERYLLMQNGSMFSTGNHPVEMLLPMYHLDKAGFEFDVATPSGNPVKLEMWAMPGEDEAVKGIYAKYLPKLKAAEKADGGGEGSGWRQLPRRVRRGVRPRRPRRAGGYSAQRGGEKDPALGLPRQGSLHHYPLPRAGRPAGTGGHRRAAKEDYLYQAATRSACSPTRWTPAPTSRSATCPAPCPGWWANACGSWG